MHGWTRRLNEKSPLLDCNWNQLENRVGKGGGEGGGCSNSPSPTYTSPSVQAGVCKKLYKDDFCLLHVFKGTFRPDWICMRMVPVPSDKPWRGHQPLYVFWFFDFTFEYLKRWAASYKNESNFLLVWITVCIEFLTSRRLDSFLYDRLRTMKSFQIFKTKIKKSKTDSGWWLF